MEVAADKHPRSIYTRYLAVAAGVLATVASAAVSAVYANALRSGDAVDMLEVDTYFAPAPVTLLLAAAFLVSFWLRGRTYGFIYPMFAPLYVLGLLQVVRFVGTVGVVDGAVRADFGVLLSGVAVWAVALWSMRTSRNLSHH
jgi:hypothetical protein